ncbi:MAG: DNA translocase FtsK 4TM domain-containing protein, partial [Bacteroidaceae bacterium]|nr:DNA translocase FtsK 4TM domain-containing protein [Bacteroidaceae bacterium]
MSKTKTKTKSTKTNSKPKQPKATPTKKQQLQQEFREVAGVGSKRDYFQFVVGMILLVVAVFMLLSMVSNIFTGGEDQAGVVAGQLGTASNYGGKLGAMCAYFMMNRLFGVMSLLIPVFLLALVLKIMLKDASPIRLWLVFIHFTLIMVLGSVDANYIQDNFMPESWKQGLSFDLGGMHGKVVLAFLTDNIGAVVTGIVLGLLTLAYIGYWFTQVFIWLFKGLHRMNSFVFGRAKQDEEIE